MHNLTIKEKIILEQIFLEKKITNKGTKTRAIFLLFYYYETCAIREKSSGGQIHDINGSKFVQHKLMMGKRLCGQTSMQNILQCEDFFQMHCLCVGLNKPDPDPC